jgi:hypothetical protein
MRDLKSLFASLLLGSVLVATMPRTKLRTPPPSGSSSLRKTESLTWPTLGMTRLPSLTW